MQSPGHPPSQRLPSCSSSRTTAYADILADWFAHNCAFAYVNQPDETAHLDGPFSPEVRCSFVGFLLSRLTDLSLLEQVNLVLLSDHWMPEVNAERVIQLNSFLNRSSYDLYGRSPLWTLSPKAGQFDYVYQALVRESRVRNFTVYRKEAVPPGLRYSKSRRILSLLLSSLMTRQETEGEAGLSFSYSYSATQDARRPLLDPEDPCPEDPWSEKQHRATSQHLIHLEEEEEERGGRAAPSERRPPREA